MASPLIYAVDISNISFPLKEPFVTAGGHKTQTHNVQVTIRLSDGTVGLAEASSSIAMPDQSQSAMRHVLADLAPELRGRPIEEYRSLIATCWQRRPYHPTAVSALECALFDAYARWQKKPLWKLFGRKAKTIETDLTLSVGTPESLAKAAQIALKKGFRRLKVKLAGKLPAEDLARLQAVRDAAPRATLVADGNQGFSLSRAIVLVQAIQRAGIKLAFFEQPFGRQDIRSMRLFRSRCTVPLFADESVRTAADAQRLIDADAVDGLNIKVAKSGLLGALDIIRLAQRAKVKLGIGCMEESKLGLAASVHLACGTGAFEWVDLDSVFLLDVTPPRGGFLIKGARLSVPANGPGIGL